MKHPSLTVAVLFGLCCTSAQAHSEALLFYPIVASFLAGGAVLGPGSAYLPIKEASFPILFIGFLLLFSLGLSWYVGALEFVPVALAYGALGGIIPFSAAYFPLRWATRRLRRAGARDHAA